MHVLFFPGIGASTRDFPEYRRLFNKLEIVRYNGCITLQDHIERINQYVNPLENTGQPYILIGHSLGANLVYRYVTQRDLQFLSRYIMIGGGPRFYPLNSWNTIFKLPRFGIAMVLLFITLGAPFLFLIYGWHGMYQRVNVTDLFRREGIANIKAIYNQTLLPLTQDPVPDTSGTPSLVIRLPNDLIFPEQAMKETKELIPSVDEIAIKRELIHFTHHLDILVVGHIHRWISRTNRDYDKILPFDIQYVLDNPESVSVEVENYEIPRWPFLIILIVASLYGFVIKFPMWYFSKLVLTSVVGIGQLLGITGIGIGLFSVMLLLIVFLLYTYYWVINPLIPTGTKNMREEYPHVSIIVPMRNESQNIVNCLTSLLNLQYPNYEIIIADGNSTDNSVSIAQQTIDQQNTRNVPVHLILEDELPDNWIGKSWGCWNAVKHSTGEFYLFTDADTIHSPTSLKQMMNIVYDNSLDGMSLIGHFKTETFWEKAILPFFKSLLLLLFGGRFNRYLTRSLAIGQYILVKSTIYHEFGGHGTIKDKIAEDIHLATKIDEIGNFQSYNANDIYHVRMYRSFSEIKEGLERNAYESVGNHPIMVIIASLGLILWRISPLLIYPIILNFGLSSLINLVFLLFFIFGLGLFIVDTRINQDPWYFALLFPLGVINVVYFLLNASIGDVGKSPKTWKGRTYNFE